MDMDPESYYDEFGVGEWERLDEDLVSRFEYENTISTREDPLPPDGLVLDAGGGPGRYSIWLAEQGYTVNHFDMSSEQVQIAKEKAKQYDVAHRVTCERGDIREITFDDNEFDAVCCLGGPLSHIMNTAAREQAVDELQRVAKSDGSVFVSVMGRLASLKFALRHGLDVYPEILQNWREAVTTPKNSGTVSKGKGGQNVTSSERQNSSPLSNLLTSQLFS